MLTIPHGFLDDVRRIFGPNEGSGVRVPVLNVLADVSNEGADRIEGATSDGLAREDAEPGLNEIEPRGTFGCEMEMNPWMRGEPRLDFRGCMRGRVIQDDVELFSAEATGDCFQEPEKVRCPVMLAAFADYLTTRHFQSGVQADDTIAPVIVRLSSGQPGTKWQKGLRSTQRLDLRFLVHRKNHGVIRRIEV